MICDLIWENPPNDVQVTIFCQSLTIRSATLDFFLNLVTYMILHYQHGRFRFKSSCLLDFLRIVQPKESAE